MGTEAKRSKKVEKSAANVKKPTRQIKNQTAKIKNQHTKSETGQNTTPRWSTATTSRSGLQKIFCRNGSTKTKIKDKADHLFTATSQSKRFCIV